MSDSNRTDWLRTLGEIEGAVQGCLAILDRYEETFRHLLDEAGHDRQRHPSPSARQGPPVEVLSARLVVAEQEADAVERLIVEQEAVWNEWHRRFATWRQSLQHPALSATPR